MEAVLVGAFFLTFGFAVACLWHDAGSDREERIAERVAERIAKDKRKDEGWR